VRPIFQGGGTTFCFATSNRRSEESVKKLDGQHQIPQNTWQALWMRLGFSKVDRSRIVIQQASGNAHGGNDLGGYLVKVSFYSLNKAMERLTHQDRCVAQQASRPFLELMYPTCVCQIWIFKFNREEEENSMTNRMPVQQALRARTVLRS